MHYNCQECTRLWNEFALATRHYLKVESKLKMATVSRDDRVLNELTPVYDRAAAERARIQEAIRLHETRACLRADAAAV